MNYEKWTIRELILKPNINEDSIRLARYGLKSNKQITDKAQSALEIEHLFKKHGPTMQMEVLIKLRQFKTDVPPQISAALKEGLVIYWAGKRNFDPDTIRLANFYGEFYLL